MEGVGLTCCTSSPSSSVRVASKSPLKKEDDGVEALLDRGGQCVPLKAGCKGVQSVDSTAEAFPSSSEGRFRYCLQLLKPEEDASFLFGPRSMLITSVGTGACGPWSRVAHISYWGTLSMRLMVWKLLDTPRRSHHLSQLGIFNIQNYCITNPPTTPPEPSKNLLLCVEHWLMSPMGCTCLYPVQLEQKHHRSLVGELTEVSIYYGNHVMPVGSQIEDSNSI
ncbi:hypothetical protein GOBAR_DD36645 [Gossypium barbadense]|nr:hypothetical protein GOBAR_DD36645 [Gossypium barbadense]